jgi:copper chaperone NosL
MKILHIASFLAMIFVLMSCGLDPEPINYGKDLCAHCNMKIMDKRHGAELVTSKGKIYKFDSGECLIDFIAHNSISEENIGHTLVTGYDNPGQLINAVDAAFLISKNLPSPMGAFLTAFSKKEEAQKKQQETGGVIYDWNSVRPKILSR